MNNNELEKKIIDCLTEVSFYTRFGDEETLRVEEAKKFANALIEEGLVIDVFALISGKLGIFTPDKGCMRLYREQEISDLKHTNEQIKVENINLHKRLENAVELPIEVDRIVVKNENETISEVFVAYKEDGKIMLELCHNPETRLKELRGKEE